MATLALIGLLIIWAAVSLAYGSLLRAVWREPVFRRPVLVLESDDWGAGPVEQVGALLRMMELLVDCRDETGRAAVMTLGIVLQTADRDAMRTDAAARYLAIGLEDPSLASVLETIRGGVAAGIFAPQLHGLAHYWEPSLVAAAADMPDVRTWLEGPGLGWTEDLPSALQSRWIDARSLPSRALPAAEIGLAIETEIAAWRRIFAERPAVAVPTTFIWQDAVEVAYAKAGVAVLMTPGARYVRRDAEGRPVRSGPPLFNGQRGQGGIMHLVRDVYFEPALGHAPESLWGETAARAALGRPALVETHRFNFCGPRASDAAFATLSEGLRLMRERLATVRFVSSAELAQVIESRDPYWLETRVLRRCAVWARRALALPGFGQAARACGLAWPLRVLGACA